ncbi:tRNA (adenosine(37)-N6)-threonylcarbamoyltransferase complex transferase subunit TsaD [Rhodospirillaceae bacterium SYSU D60014]|uniref:tRNA (adenosine(37)-N6)-threonylcarbamoyltransferase complex transferase subunit TsaD n=1 Tax=Virgifigura deserti TaxID=2268457 RepID=UPI000E6612B6
MIVLGIETSCDETAVALVDDRRHVRADLVLSQLAEHRPYGGVVPEIAARSHLDHLDGLIRRAMAEADLGFDQIDGVAVTGGPGLIGGIIVGVMTAKAIAAVRGLPFVAVNHLEGHALTVRLTDDLAFPYLLLLVSGGHCQLLMVEGVGRYRRLGTTVDDAAGEAFDKAAKLVGLGYPGGPAVEQAAARATEHDGDRFSLPRPMVGRPGCDFSFSGLKTALRQRVAAITAAAPDGRLSDRDRDALAAAFQTAVADCLADRTANAIRLVHADGPAPTARPTALVVAGGVAANRTLRARLEQVAAAGGLRLVAPPLRLCTDNAAMIAWAGLERLRQGGRDDLDFAPRPRWPLDPAAPKATGAGVKA